MDIVKVAVIGLGGVAQLVHLPNLAKIRFAQIQSVAEVKSSRLNTIADKFKISERYKDYKELLEKSDIDAVIVTTPTSLHKEIVIAALNAGKDVLVEKPIGRNYQEALAMAETAKKCNRKLMVGMNLRYRPDTMMLKTMINAGEIGDPFYIKAIWIRRQSSSEQWFTRREEAGGGVLLDLGIHLLDLSLWILKYPDVKTIQTHNYYHKTTNIEDTSVSFLGLQDSKIINIETSWSLPVSTDSFQLIVYGTSGSITLSPLHIYKKVDEQFIDFIPSISETPSQMFKKSYLNELKSFLGAVKGFNPVFSPGEEAAERLKIIELMYKSAKKNYEVKVN